MKQTTRTIFIGDVHGCYNELELLVKKLQLTQNDTVYLTGDLILKGPKSIKVLKFVKKNNFKWVQGNKEYEILKSIENGEYDHKEDKKLGKKLLSKYPDLLEYIKNTPYYIETEKFILFHAGIVPNVEIADQEITDLCYLRDYKNKPWYEYYTGEKKLIYGHWALDGLKIRDNTIGLDSGCVYGGKLTAYILETGEIVQQKALKIHKNPFKKGTFQYHLKSVSFSFFNVFTGK